MTSQQPGIGDVGQVGQVGEVDGVDVAAAVGVLDSLYPPSTAQSWDAVGLVCGDPQAPVRRVLLAVDPTSAVVDEALEWGADLLVTHHPLLLRGVHGVPATTPKGRVVHRLVRGGCALYVAHTNADVALPGVSDALARVLGLHDLRPLVPQSLQPLDKVVVFVPHADADRLVDALAAAGAGTLGDYSRAAWTTTGTGTFRPEPGARPAIGRVGQVEVVPETRVEMVLPRARRQAVLQALRAAHPYEEPAFDLLETADPGGRAGLGRVGRLDQPVTLEAFARRVAEVLPATAQGVRVAGDADAVVETVAVLGGAGDDAFDAVRASGADVYVTADLRHHPASEARERAAHDGGGRPFLVDVAHWASEWPWLAGCESRLATGLARRGAAATTVETRVSTARTDPWTSHVPSRGPLLIAPAADQARLLEVQAVDTRLDQIAHRRRTMPEHAEPAALETRSTQPARPGRGRADPQRRRPARGGEGRDRRRARAHAAHPRPHPARVGSGRAQGARVAAARGRHARAAAERAGGRRARGHGAARGGAGRGRAGHRRAVRACCARSTSSPPAATPPTRRLAAERVQAGGLARPPGDRPRRRAAGALREDPRRLRHRGGAAARAPLRGLPPRA
nr:Nif3-like dinuclear metal center hexameric protein [Angustibacter aerolatus]